MFERSTVLLHQICACPNFQKMGTACASKMVVANYIVMWHHNLNTHNHDNLRSYLTQSNLKDAFF